MATVKAILIDPFSQTVNPITLTDTRDPDVFLREIYALLGTDDVSSSSLPNGDRAWYDDLGAFHPWPKQRFFSLPLYPGSLPGKWVIMRSQYVLNEDTDYDQMEDCRTNIDELRATIRWIAPQDAAMPAPTFSRAEVIDGKMVAVGPSEPLDPSGPRIWTYKDNPGGSDD